MTIFRIAMSWPGFIALSIVIGAVAAKIPL